ncbi:DUF2231 domain-containing protein [Agrococcus citreus]|uniref:DUF2231 domain-containing protein n=1 Tax=Agrococcus citreus TaxID=84643 RepID=A0ABP4JD51_9MICO
MDPLQTIGAFEVTGLPLHPLLVHAVVVLAPLTALALILGSVWPTARRRLGIVTPLAALLLVALVPITVAAGQALSEVLGPAPAIDTHSGYGQMLLPWVIGMFLVAAAQWAWFRWGAERTTDAGPRRRRAVPIVLAVLAVGLGVGTTVMVALIGDSGARAVWGGILG